VLPPSSKQKHKLNIEEGDMDIGVRMAGIGALREPMGVRMSTHNHYFSCFYSDKITLSRTTDFFPVSPYSNWFTLGPYPGRSVGQSVR
jgi:hypothetical protein